MEVEGTLRLLVGDQGSTDDLRAALEVTAKQAREVRAAGIALIEELLATGGPFPQRLHLIEPLVSFYDEFNRLLIRWCEATLIEMDAWPDIRDVGLTSGGRRRLQQLVDNE
jgi:PadR family transcriptional regulator AphA